jgi:5-oxoprolinase (ATP-hydrolysing)
VQQTGTLKFNESVSLQGISLVSELIDAYGLDVVQAYMHHIQANAEVAVRDMLREIGTKVLQRSGVSELQAEDYLDDGSPIRLKVGIDIQQGSAVCDFRYRVLVLQWCILHTVFPVNCKCKLSLYLRTMP